VGQSSGALGPPVVIRSLEDHTGQTRREETLRPLSGPASARRRSGELRRGTAVGAL